jgi:hypothetical protein
MKGTSDHVVFNGYANQYKTMPLQAKAGTPHILVVGQDGSADDETGAPVVVNIRAMLSRGVSGAHCFISEETCLDTLTDLGIQ